MSEPLHTTVFDRRQGRLRGRDRPHGAEAGAAQGGTDVEAARRVLHLEAAGLNALAAALDLGFALTVEILAAVSGRVVVSGMGKSGHVARKIAATFASTGTPALFVHPAEASHGDLGMITSGDAVICLSNSGETAELANVVAYTRRFDIPLIGICSREHSALAEAADQVLLLPAAAEACPIGLAPTTSSTMMLALGDALAVALMERRGFSADQFQVFHPGGKLGQRLVKVADLMHGGAALPLVPLGTVMSEALVVMTGKRFGCVGVLDDAGRLAGIITDGDLRRHMHPDLLAQKVEEIMTRNPKTIRAEALAAEAIAVMNAHAIMSLFATEDGQPLGILHMHDCLRAGVA